MKKLLVAVIFYVFILSCTILVQPIKVLVITGKHKYNEASFNDMINGFNGMNCTIKEMGDNPGALFENVDDFNYDAIAMYNFKQELTSTQRRNLKNILNNGVGLTVIHHAIAGFPDWLDYEDIIGATYVLEEQTRDGKYYPRPTWKHGVDMNIRVEDPSHPITEGISDFIIHDETYKNWVYHDGNNLLLSTDNELSNPQIAWTRSSSGNRVFYIQLGHDEHTFEDGNYRKLLKQGIAWTTESEM